MKCVIPGANVKVFGRAIHCLSKIGDELYIEPLEEGLALRTVNLSRSAYASFIFSPNFFASYDDGVGSHVSDLADDEDDVFRCRITMKSCLAVFKSLNSIEKSVDRCQIELAIQEARLVFQLYCKHGIVKTYNLTYQETETLQAVFSKDLCPNKIVAESKVLCDIVMNFQTSLEEVTLHVNPEQVTFKKYVDDEPDPSKVMHTEMSLIPDEFQHYSIGVDTEVTFCLKELRAILAFSDATNLPLSIHFETTGKPIVFCIESEQTLEANFVLATLADATASQSSQTSGSQLHSTGRISTARNTSKINKTKGHNATRKSRELDTGKPSTAGHRTAIHTNSGTPDVTFPDDDILRLTTTHQRATISHGQAELGPVKDSNYIPDSPVIPVIPTLTSLKPEDEIISENDHKDAECDSDLDDTVPGTPPSKKFKSLFFGCSQASQSVVVAPTRPVAVLVEDTEDEDSD